MARQAYRGELEHLRSMHVKAVDERNKALDIAESIKKAKALTPHPALIWVPVVGCILVMLAGIGWGGQG